jgi:hypothetical protein
MKKFPILAACLLVPLAVWAGVNREGYRPLASAPSTYRSTGLSSDDSLDWSSPLSTSGATQTVMRTDGNPNLLLNGSFSSVGATVTLRTGLYHSTDNSTFTFLGVADVSTLTASSREFWDGTEYSSEAPILVDTSAATHYEVRVLDVSAGNVEIKPILFGTDSK